MAFTNPSAVQSSLLSTGAITGLVLHNMTMGLIDGLRAARADREDAHAYAAWDHALGTARHSAAQMTTIAKAAVVAAMDAQDEADALRLEVAQLRHAVAQREACIRALA